MTKAQEASASSFVEDAQSSLAQADGVDDSVDSHDLATSDGEAHHRDWSPIDGNDDSGRAIYQRWSRHYSQMGAILLEAAPPASPVRPSVTFLVASCHSTDHRNAADVTRDIEATGFMGDSESLDAQAIKS